MKTSLLLLLLLLTSVCYAQGDWQKSSHPIDKKIQALANAPADKRQGDATIRETAETLWQAEVARLVKKLAATLPLQNRKYLTASQAAWQKYADAQSSLVWYARNPDGVGVEWGQLLTQTTTEYRRRAFELQRLIQEATNNTPAPPKKPGGHD